MPRRAGHHQSAQRGISGAEIRELAEKKACDDRDLYGALVRNARRLSGPHLRKLMRRGSVISDGLSPKISVKVREVVEADGGRDLGEAHALFPQADGLPRRHPARVLRELAAEALLEEVTEPRLGETDVARQPRHGLRIEWQLLDALDDAAAARVALDRAAAEDLRVRPNCAPSR